MSITKLVGLIVLCAALILGSSSIFIVQQAHGALVLHLGELMKNSKTGKVDEFNPGIHFKLPFISSVQDFDMRLQNLDVDSSRILTAEQKYVIVDYYAKWRIDQLPLYYKRTGGRDMQARVLLEQKMNDSLRSAFGKRTIKEVISSQRGDVMNSIVKQAEESAQGLGIKLIDVRIRSIDLPPEVTDSVYQRMSTEREQVATTYRSQGKADAESIQAQADADVTIRLATARTTAAQVRAKGDGDAARIYTAAYDQDPNFYSMYRSLQAYRDVFRNKHSTMVLSPKGEFFRYFSGLKGLVSSKNKSNA